MLGVKYVYFSIPKWAPSFSFFPDCGQTCTANSVELHPLKAISDKEQLVMLCGITETYVIDYSNAAKTLARFSLPHSHKGVQRATSRLLACFINPCYYGICRLHDIFEPRYILWTRWRHSAAPSFLLFARNQLLYVILHGRMLATSIGVINPFKRTNIKG